jgi:hypothetical protein
MPRMCGARKSALAVRGERALNLTTCREAESKEKHGVWDPMPELTITLPYVHSKVESNTFTMGKPYARVDFIRKSGTLDFASRRLGMVI